MADDNRQNDDKKKGGEFKVPPRNYLLWIAILALVPLLMLFKDKATQPSFTLSLPEFIKLDAADLISGGTIIYDVQSPLQEIYGKYFKTDAAGNKIMEVGRAVEVPFKVKAHLPEKLDERLIMSGKYEVKTANPMLMGFLYQVLIMGLDVL